MDASSRPDRRSGSAVGIELIHLRCFVELAEDLHFGRAADRLHLGISTLSRRVGELERLIGVRLFERTSHQVRLTAAGEMLVRPAAQALDGAVAFEAMAADAARGAVGGLRAAYAPGTGEVMTILVRHLRHREPPIVLHPEQMLSMRVAAAVRSGAVDIGITHVPPGPDLGSIVLSESPLTQVVMMPGHPLAHRPALQPSDLLSETLVGAARTLTGEPASDGFQVREANVTTEAQLFDLVAAGFGLFVASEAMVRRNPRTDVVVRPVQGWEQRARELLVWRLDDDSAAVKVVRQSAEQVLAELAPLTGP